MKQQKYLLKSTKRVDIEKRGESLFLMLFTGITYSYKREDRFYVVFMGDLKD